MTSATSRDRDIAARVKADLAKVNSAATGVPHQTGPNRGTIGTKKNDTELGLILADFGKIGVSPEHTAN